MPSNYNKLSKSPPFFKFEDFSEKWEDFIDTLTHYCQRVKIYREKLLPNNIVYILNPVHPQITFVVLFTMFAM